MTPKVVILPVPPANALQYDAPLHTSLVNPPCLLELGLKSRELVLVVNSIYFLVVLVLSSLSSCSSSSMSTLQVEGRAAVAMMAMLQSLVQWLMMGKSFSEFNSPHAQQQ